jgi:hypothetical protein
MTTSPERHREIVARLAELNAQTAALLAELRGDSRTLLDQYIDASLHRRDGFTVAFSELYSGFKAWLPDRERESWPKARVLQELPFQTADEGRTDQPRKMVQGLSWHPAPPLPEPPKPEHVKPKNPDYDEAMIRELIKRFRNEGVLNTYVEYSKKLNELGHCDKYGNAWLKETVSAVVEDYPY